MMSGSVSTFLESLNVTSLLSLLMQVVAALFCITWHEVSHGLAAMLLGDPTAKSRGRLSLNPLKHLDPLGLLMMLVARVGWAKPVPIDSRYFKHPKRDIAITALAGPVSNFVLSLLGMLAASGVYHFWLVKTGSVAAQYVLVFLIEVAVLSTGLGLFNLIPISPLDGSKVLFALLPDRIYYTILRYERWGMLVMIALVLLGVFSSPLSWLIYRVMWLLCKVTAFPYLLLLYIL